MPLLCHNTSGTVSPLSNCHCHNLTLSHCHTVTISHSDTVTLSVTPLSRESVRSESDRPDSGFDSKDGEEEEGGREDMAREEGSPEVCKHNNTFWESDNLNCEKVLLYTIF